MKTLFSTKAFTPKFAGIIYFLVWVTIYIPGCKKTEFFKAVTGAVVSSAQHGIHTTGILPNIVLIVGDDIGYEIPACNGGQSYATPNIDKMAERGIRFTQCYGSPNCSPARFMLLTGKYNFRNYTEWGVMSRSQRTIGNMLKDAGYATCYAGKWQLDGGDTSIRTFGFDHYSVWLPYKLVPEEATGGRYKNAPIYQNGAFLPRSQIRNKYSVDMFTDYIVNFIDSNKQRPFFIYYSIPLGHKPFNPTPDDPEFATWDITDSEPRFFPGMVQYMDKQLRILVAKIRNVGLEQNTLFIFMGDNGSPKGIISQFNGIAVPGEKGQTTTYGTHVPLIFYWPGYIMPGTVTQQLVDFTDFMPTLAGIAGIPVPANYGTLDGKTFYPVLMGNDSSSRNYIFNHFQPLISQNSSLLERYIQNSTYKLYDDNKFFNIVNDVEEQQPIREGAMTDDERQLKAYFQQVLSQMHN